MKSVRLFFLLILALIYVAPASAQTEQTQTTPSQTDAPSVNEVANVENDVSASEQSSDAPQKSGENLAEQNAQPDAQTPEQETTLAQEFDVDNSASADTDSSELATPSSEPIETASESEAKVEEPVPAAEEVEAQEVAEEVVMEEEVAPLLNSLQAVLVENFKLISKPSAKTVEPVIAAIQQSGHEAAGDFLAAWQAKEVWFRKDDEQLGLVREEEDGSFTLIDASTGEELGSHEKKELKQIKPNSGVRSRIGLALVADRLTSSDIEVRRASLETITRDPEASHLAALRLALESETDPELLAQAQNLERLLTISFDDDETARVEAISGFAGSLSLDVRAKLNPLMDSTVRYGPSVPSDQNVARTITPNRTFAKDNGTSQSHNIVDSWRGISPELSTMQAYELLIAGGDAPALISREEQNSAIIANIIDGEVAGLKLAELNTDASRDAAYAELAAQGIVPAAPTMADIEDAVSAFSFYATFDEPNSAVTDAVRETLASINSAVQFNTYIDLGLDAISLGSIYFLAAIGLAITFGVMRVINMAHGEFIMMGAYSGYVVQQFVPDYTLSIIIAIPVGFAVTFAAGVAMERLIIRHLYNRQLETLLATFGVSIALQQLAKNIFGTQARPLTAPHWLDGSWVMNDVVSISWIRIAIFGLSIIFFVGLWFTLNKTRFGLETRAVTQNPRMAASMGINPDRINMLTFGLGSGIAGIAGVAIGLYAKVTSELGADYIVQSFMTVVVGGVGNIWGTLAGAGLIGILQKFIENANPSNTLAAQTYMIIFIIIFIQFRPRGLIALKGRAAEN